MANSKDDVKRLREETGAGVMDCKRALDEAKGDFSKAKTLIKERGLAKAKEKADREAKEGVVEAYVHAGGRIGAMVELSSETDFVARNPDFRELAKEIAMQVAAMDPKDLDDLLEQAYIRDASKTINALALQSQLESVGVPVRVQSAITIAEVAEPYIRRRAIHQLEKGSVVIFAAGTGNPFFTSDTAAALRAAEINADAILMGKNRVDGVYDADPQVVRGAKKYEELTYRDLLEKRLGVMDATAAALAEERGIPIIVFDISQSDAMVRAAKGEHIGTLVHSE